MTVKSLEVTTIQKSSEGVDQTVPESIGLREVFDTNQERLDVLKQRVGFTRPANTTVCTALAVPECLVEIEVEARLGSGTPQ